MEEKEALKQVYSHIAETAYSQIMREDFHKFKGVRKIFIIRSSSLEVFRNFISLLFSINENTFVYVLSHARDKEEITDICKGRCEVIEYSGNNTYNVDVLKNQINYIKSLNINEFCMLFSNRQGIGYENICEIMLSLTDKNFYAYNSYGELLNIKGPSKYFTSLNAIKALSEWYWEKIDK
ncbi:hypothetical protein ACSVDA_04790 [Cytobacillus sp. Hm23]